MKMPNEKRFDRRSFIKAGGATLTGLALARRSLRAQTAAAQGADYSERRVFPLNHRWLYSERAAPEGTRPGFNDTSFARVNIPSTVSSRVGVATSFMAPIMHLQARRPLWQAHPTTCRTSGTFRRAKSKNPSKIRVEGPPRPRTRVTTRG